MEYKATEPIILTYHLASRDDRHRGQRALRAAQEQFSMEEIERQAKEDAILEQAEHQAGLGGMDVEDVHADVDKQIKSDSDDTLM
jgi:hypothetical protein